jgi:hypothetical protein
MTGRSSHVNLILSSVLCNGEEQLLEPVLVGHVRERPSIKENSGVIYTTQSSELHIHGTGLIGARDVDLYFDPPLVKEIMYEYVSEFPLSKNEIVLHLH